MQALNLLVALVLEMGLLAAFGFWGFHLGHSNVRHWVSGLGAPFLLAIIWGRVAAPKAAHRLESLRLLAFKIIVFALGTAALYTSGQKRLGVAFGVVSLVSVTLSFAWKQ